MQISGELWHAIRARMWGHMTITAVLGYTIGHTNDPERFWILPQTGQWEVLDMYPPHIALPEGL